MIQIEDEESAYKLNYLSEKSIGEELFRCCGSASWVDRMIQHRPFQGMQDLLDKANTTWWLLSISDWKCAFSAHPKIGKVDSFNTHTST